MCSSDLGKVGRHARCGGAAQIPGSPGGRRSKWAITKEQKQESFAVSERPSQAKTQPVPRTAFLSSAPEKPKWIQIPPEEVKKLRWFLRGDAGGCTRSPVFKGLWCTIEYAGTRVYIGGWAYLNLFRLACTSLLPPMPAEKPFSLTFVKFCISSPHESAC